MNSPLADRMRPAELSEVVGQKHILGEGKVLYNIINSGNIPNMNGKNNGCKYCRKKGE